MPEPQGLTRLNLGCGTDIRPGFLNVDLVKGPGVALVYDLNRLPWPWADNTFELVLANHFLEHTDDLIGVLREIWRISRPQARLQIRVPYFASFLSFKDLTHKHRFTYDAFDNWDARHDADGRQVTHMNEPMRFQIRRRLILMFSRLPGWKYHVANAPFWIPMALINLFPRLYERFFFFYLPASNIYYELEVVKHATVPDTEPCTITRTHLQ